jgi:hypothetical protein
VPGRADFKTNLEFWKGDYWEVVSSQLSEVLNLKCSNLQ